MANKKNQWRIEYTYNKPQGVLGNISPKIYKQKMRNLSFRMVTKFGSLHLSMMMSDTLEFFKTIEMFTV